MMILLNGRSLAAKNRFQPERMKLELNERGSTATLTLNDRAPEISINDWLQAEDGPAKGIVWRVKSVETQYDQNTRTVTLEHVICKLKDRLIFGEVKPKDISGSSTNPSASQTIRYILGYQDDWVLGTVERDRANPYGFNGDSLYNAIEIVSNSLTESQWEYDFSSYPFTLHLRSINMNVASEMRTDRNIKTLRKTIDRTRMYTRHYPIGKEDLHIAGDFVAKNEDKYGIIAKVETDQSIDTEAALRAWAQERLERHCEPIVTVTISGLDLSEATGESLDRFVIGKACRVPVPELDTVITERVVKLSYPDVINDPMTVTVTLGNELTDVARIIRTEAEKAARGGGGRGAAKKAAEDHAWFVDTEDHVGMVAEAVAGEGADKDWSRVASVMVDGNGIHQRVTYTEDELVKQEAGIEIAQNSINQFVKAVGKDGKITAASICLAINEDNSSSAKIEADKIHLLGETIAKTISADYINTKIATIPTLKGMAAKFSGNVSCAGLIANQVYVGSGAPYMNISSGLNAVRINGPTSNQYTLQYRRFSDNSWQDAGTFSRAVASWHLGWGRGDVTVTANPQNQRVEIEIGGGTPVWDDRKVTIPILARNSVTSGTVTWTDVTATAPDPVWSYSQYPSSSNTPPSGVATSYDLDTHYTYHTITVTVDGVTKKIGFRLTNT